MAGRHNILLFVLALLSTVNCLEEDDSVCMLHRGVSLVQQHQQLKPAASPQEKKLSLLSNRSLTNQSQIPRSPQNRSAAQNQTQVNNSLPNRSAVAAPNYSHSQAHMAPKTLAAAAVVDGLLASYSVTASLVLILLCMVSSRSTIVTTMTWTLSSQAFAAFYATVVFAAIRDGFTCIARSWFYSLYTWVSGLGVLCAIFLVFNASLLGVRSCPRALLALGTIGPSLLSIASIDVFRMIQGLPAYITADRFECICIFTVAVFIVVASIAFFTHARDRLDIVLRENSQLDGQSSFSHFCRSCFDDGSASSFAWGEWRKQAGKCEDQFAAITLGYFTSKAAEGTLRQAYPLQTISLNFSTLLLVVAFCFVLGLSIAHLTRNASDGISPNRITSIALSTFLAAASWCLLHAMRWQYNYGFLHKSLGIVPESMIADLLVALSITIFVMLFYILVCLYFLQHRQWDETVQRSSHAITSALGFIVGAAWIVCLLAALPDFSSSLPMPTMTPSLEATTLISVFVLPSWIVFVLPRTISEKA